MTTFQDIFQSSFLSRMGSVSPLDMGLALVPFFDAGFNIDHKTMADDFNDKIVYSAGLELRWRSPMGDLRLAYGYPLSKDYDGEREQGRLEFSMGQFF